METEKKIILVTGGTGLVGSAIKSVLKDKENSRQNEEWIFVGSKDADLTNAEQTKALFDKYKPTHVVHLAAIVGGVFFHLKNNLEAFRKNIHINDNVLHTSFEIGIKKIVSCLSTCVFPDDTTYPIDESMIQNGEPHMSNYGYGYSKRMILVASRAYNEQYGCKYTSLIPCNIFGPRDNFHPDNSHVVPGLIRKMYDATVRGDKTYTVCGTGKPLRQFIYSKDLAKIFIWAIRDYQGTEPIIAAVDEIEEITVAQLAEMIKKCLKYDGTLLYDPNQSDGQYKKTASNKRLRSHLPDFKFTSLQEALQQTVDWYVKHHADARN